MISSSEIPKFKPYFLNTTAGTNNTSSTSFVDYPGPIDKTFRKQRPGTALLIYGLVGMYMFPNAGIVQIGLRINSVDTLIGHFFSNDINTHREVHFNVPIMSGLAPGSYTARVRWRVAGSTTIFADFNDHVRIRIQESYFG